MGGSFDWRVAQGKALLWRRLLPLWNPQGQSVPGFMGGEEGQGAGICGQGEEDPAMRLGGRWGRSWRAALNSVVFLWPFKTQIIKST